MSPRNAIAQALAASPLSGNPLAGNPGAFDGGGLQQPAIDPVLLATTMGPGIARALVGGAKMAPRMMVNEAGALFPEGEIPTFTSKAMAEEAKEVLPELRQAYIRNAKNYDWHASMGDWPRVLGDKWAMLKNAGGN